MKVFRKIYISVLLLPLLLSGTVSARSAEKTAVPNVIQQVQIVCRRGNVTITRLYVQPHKISAILNYLRLLRQKGSPTENPEQILGDSFKIVLYDSTGQRSIYRQRANRFLSENSRPWRCVQPEQAGRLYPLIASLPTDKKGVFNQ